MRANKCRLCGEPKPENIHHLWSCCGDGPATIPSLFESLACAKRRLAAAEQRAVDAEQKLEAVRRVFRDSYDQPGYKSACGYLWEHLPKALGASKPLDPVTAFLQDGPCPVPAPVATESQGRCPRCGCIYIEGTVCSASNFTLPCSEPAPVATDTQARDSAETYLIGLMRNVCDEVGLPEEKGERCPILEALNQAHNHGAQGCASRFARQGLLREQPATPAPVNSMGWRRNPTPLPESADCRHRWIARDDSCVDCDEPGLLPSLDTAPAGDAPANLLDEVLGPFDDEETPCSTSEYLAAISSADDDDGQLVAARVVPAGDAEVSHERALHNIQLLHTGDIAARSRLLAYISQQEARQKQAEREVAELARERDNALGHRNQLQTDLEAEWTGRLELRKRFGAREDETFPAFIERIIAERATLQGKDEEIAELREMLGSSESSALAEKTRLVREFHESFAQRDELSRKLEAAERQARQNARLAGATRRVAAGLLEAFPQHFEKNNNALLDAAHEARACLAELWPDGPGPQFPPDQAPPAKPLTEDDVGLGQLCVACGAHWITDAQLDKLNDAIAPWRSRALAAEAKLAEAAKEQVTRDDDCPPDGHAVSVYASENGDTLAFPGSLFTTVRACIDCGVLINGGPTRCLTCADKPLTRADVKAIIAEVAERANGRGNWDEPALLKLAEAAKEGS